MITYKKELKKTSLTNSKLKLFVDYANEEAVIYSRSFCISLGPTYIEKEIATDVKNLNASLKAYSNQ